MDLHFKGFPRPAVVLRFRVIASGACPRLPFHRLRRSVNGSIRDRVDAFVSSILFVARKINALKTLHRIASLGIFGHDHPLVIVVQLSLTQLHHATCIRLIAELTKRVIVIRLSAEDARVLPLPLEAKERRIRFGHGRTGHGIRQGIQLLIRLLHLHDHQVLDPKYCARRVSILHLALDEIGTAVLQ